MNVSDLIEVLQALDPKAEVVLEGADVDGDGDLVPVLGAFECKAHPNAVQISIG